MDNFSTSLLPFEAMFDIMGYKMRERENIFSWRGELQGKSLAERAQWFYDEKLIPILADDVAQAEQNRQVMNHQSVEETFTGWTINRQDQRILSKLSQREKARSINLEQQVDSIRVGFAGLGRIQHVDANSQLKLAANKDPIIERVSQVQQLYKRLGLEHLVPWTIHGGSIYWPSEVAQDQANTQKIFDEPEQAKKILSQAINQTGQVVENLKGQELDLFTSDKQLKEKDYQAWRQRKIYLGALSALGVLRARQGRITRRLPWVFVGLNQVYRAHQHEPNPHRLATLAIWAFFDAFSQNYQSHYQYRLKVARFGLWRFNQAALVSPKDALLALSQHLKESPLGQELRNKLKPLQYVQF